MREEGGGMGEEELRVKPGAAVAPKPFTITVEDWAVFKYFFLASCARGGERVRAKEGG